jgi:hypothetical protein
MLGSVRGKDEESRSFSRGQPGHHSCTQCRVLGPSPTLLAWLSSDGSKVTTNCFWRMPWVRARGCS